MNIFYSEQHLLRQAQTELSGGELVRPFECPERVDYILAELEQRGFAKPYPAQEFGLVPVEAVHDAGYISFLESAWDIWLAAGNRGEAIPSIWPARSMRSDKIPADIEAQMGYYSLAAETSISPGTWKAALAAKDVALSAAASVLQSNSEAFALCRPPGHHAASSQFGGYCFLNNAAIAAQYILDHGAARVAILDVDFHHGNGTQEIFYHRNDVLMLSLHGDPEYTFPYFLGYQEETGSGEGQGYTFNYPMPHGSNYTVWKEALSDAIDQISCFQPDCLVVSLGVDTFEKDPISAFCLKSQDFRDYGARIGQLKIPTVYVMEGGYAIEEIGVNTVNVLDGHIGR